MIFLTDNTMIADDSTTTTENVATIGNSGILGVGEADVGVGEEDDVELTVASTVPLKSL